MTISTFEKPETRRSRLAGGHGKTLLLLFTVLATAGGGQCCCTPAPRRPPHRPLWSPSQRRLNGR